MVTTPLVSGPPGPPLTALLDGARSVPSYRSRRGVFKSRLEMRSPSLKRSRDGGVSFGALTFKTLDAMRNGNRFSRFPTLRLLARLLCAGLFTIPHAQGGTLLEDLSMTVDGTERTWHAYVPDELPVAHPVVVALHGGSSSAATLLDPNRVSPFKEWLEIADEAGLLVLFPNGTDASTGLTEGDSLSWNDGRTDNSTVSGQDDVAFFDRLLDWTEANFAADPARIYFTGSSNGGLMCFRVAREMSHRVAAIAPFIANSPKHRTNGDPEFPISVFICNGQGEEEFMPWDGGFVAANPAAGEVLSATATRDLWVGLTGVDPSPEVTPIPNLEAEGSTAGGQLFTGGVDGAEVAFVVVANGGHAIPSRAHRYSDASLSRIGLGIQNHDFEAFREAWAFLKRQRLGKTRSPSFDEWMTARGFTDPAADPDRDGRSHAATYLGGSRAEPILSIEPSGDGVHLRLNRRETATGLSARVERSQDLHEWSRVEGTLAIEAANRDGDGTVSLRLQDSQNPAAAAVFYRVKLLPVE